ncbi:hypothetical protein [Paenibacillus sedimenti]|uniref:Flagellar protein n=1 Tax=Paenibacillus sedimenti TaxID=2770274 RepID=A0A926KS60_9BACL|nr:hypothetical protein [Paenibacillus sedimenti]MBD0383089.1 hypothetical protein [Paenibacillus sedimenti]
MSICNCEQCGQVIITNNEKRCKSCSQLQLMDTRKVKDFVRSNPRATILEVYHQTGVSLQTIKELLRA